jgi:peptide deformylase
MLEEDKLITHEIKIKAKEADRIITTGDPERFQLLRVRSNECDFPLADSDRDIVANMTRIMDEMGDEAAGLAAVQVGFPRRIFIMREANGDCVTAINPIVTDFSSMKTKKIESCLSIPTFVLALSRPKRVTLLFKDVDGEEHTKEYSGMQARAVCHEMDHLNGKLLDAHMADLVKADQKKKGVRLVERSLAKKKNRQKRKRNKK